MFGTYSVIGCGGLLPVPSLNDDLLRRILMMLLRRDATRPIPYPFFDVAVACLSSLFVIVGSVAVAEGLLRLRLRMRVG